MGVGHIVENDAAPQIEKLPFTGAQSVFYPPAVRQQFVTGSVKTVFRCATDLRSEYFRKSCAVHPVGQRPFTERFDQAADNHQLCDGNTFPTHSLSAQD